MHYCAGDGMIIRLPNHGVGTSYRLEIYAVTGKLVSSYAESFGNTLPPLLEVSKQKFNKGLPGGVYTFVLITGDRNYGGRFGQ